MNSNIIINIEPDINLKMALERLSNKASQAVMAIKEFEEEYISFNMMSKKFDVVGEKK